MRLCAWVNRVPGSGPIPWRCSAYPEAAANCPVSCGTCGPPTDAPTVSPTVSPTDAPTVSPTLTPTATPTVSPTLTPTVSPTVSPTDAPTSSPSSPPTVPPTAAPTATPSVSPTAAPTPTPSGSPTSPPSGSPTPVPTPTPSVPPTATPTLTPTSGRVACGDPHTSGWGQYQTYAVDISTSVGWVTVQYNMFTIADQLELIYEGDIIYDSGMVTGSHTAEKYINGTSSVMYIRMTGHQATGTKWQFIVHCKLSDGTQVC